MIAVNWRWLALRLAAIPLIFLAVSFLFFFLYYGPFSTLDDPCRLCTREQRNEIRREFGLDSPWPQRYGEWVSDAVRLDFGTSWRDRMPIRETFSERWQSTAELLLIATLLGAGAGFAAAWLARTGSTALIAALVVAMLFALPTFLVADLALIVPLETWDYAPPIGRHVSFREEPWGNLRQFLVPGASLSLATIWPAYRAARASLIAGTTARAVWFAVARAAPVALAGSFLVELLFTIPGISLHLWQAISVRDAPVLQFYATLLISLWIVSLLFASPLNTSPGAARPAGRSSVVLLVSLAVIALFVLAGLNGPYVAPYGATDFAGAYGEGEGPSWGSPLGTTRFGFDILSRILIGARAALESALPVLIGVVVGTLIGIVSARVLRRRWPSIRLKAAPLEATAIPALLLAVVLLPAFDYRERSFVVLFATMAFLLSAYTSVATLRADASDGDSFAQSLRRAAAAAGAVLCELAAVALLTSATLDFMELGWARIDAPTWGGDANMARQFLPFRYNQLITPCVPLALFVLALLLASHELRDRSEASRQRRSP